MKKLRGTGGKIIILQDYFNYFNFSYALPSIIDFIMAYNRRNEIVIRFMDHCIINKTRETKNFISNTFLNILLS